MVADKQTKNAGKSRQRLTAENMAVAQKIRRDLTGGRPPAPELKTPASAATAARMLYREIEVRMPEPESGNFCVTVAYVSTDLSVLGFSPFFGPGAEAETIKFLSGNIPLGLIFGIVDAEAADDESKIVMGARPFFETSQTWDWLDELIGTVRVEISLKRQ